MFFIQDWEFVVLFYRWVLFMRALRLGWRQCWLLMLIVRVGSNNCAIGSQYWPDLESNRAIGLENYYSLTRCHALYMYVKSVLVCRPLIYISRRYPDAVTRKQSHGYNISDHDTSAIMHQQQSTILTNIQSCTWLTIIIDLMLYSALTLRHAAWSSSGGSHIAFSVQTLGPARNGTSMNVLLA